MKTCVVHMCGNDSSKRPDLTYFSLPPKHTSMREEWLEILGSKSSHQHVFVCELHFRAKDIREGKKELKAHSVPVLRLGQGQIDPIDSDDEFITFGTNGEAEIELNESLSITPQNKKTEQELLENQQVKQELNPDVESVASRRPSRRAAIVAAQKISNTARSYSLKEDPEFSSNSNITPKPAVKTERAQKRKKSPTPPPPPPPPQPPASPPPPESPIEISLDMECDEEILSEAQAETLAKAQSHYNIVMKGLRDLVQWNVKVIHTDPYGTVIMNHSPIPSQTIPVKKAVISTSKPQTNTLVIRTQAPRIVPVALSVAKSQPSIIII